MLFSCQRTEYPSQNCRAQDFACRLPASKLRGLTPAKRLKLLIPGDTAIPILAHTMGESSIFDVVRLPEWQQKRALISLDGVIQAPIPFT
jgi:hypothetical protein